MGKLPSGVLGMIGFASMLRRRYLLTWLLFGSAFLLLCYRWQGDGGILNIGGPIRLLVIYAVVSQAVATLCAHWAEDYIYGDPLALFFASAKAGLVAAVGSVLIHLGIWHTPFESGVAEFRSLGAALIGGAIFPFLGCIAAAALLRN